jgi:hypothetical protein
MCGDICDACTGAVQIVFREIGCLADEIQKYGTNIHIDHNSTMPVSPHAAFVEVSQ